jgi:hypothetical protein
VYPLPSLPMTLSQAIARQEGWYAETETRCQRNLNPGNIEYGQLARAHKAIGTDGRFAIFATFDDGFDCLISLLQLLVYQTLSIERAISVYAPSDENDTATYVRNVCAWCEKQPTDLVSTVSL